MSPTKKEGPHASIHIATKLPNNKPWLIMGPHPAMEKHGPIHLEKTSSSTTASSTKVINIPRFSEQQLSLSHRQHPFIENLQASCLNQSPFYHDTTSSI